MKQKYDKLESKADAFLGKLIMSPWTFAILVSAAAAAVVLLVL